MSTIIEKMTGVSIRSPFFDSQKLDLFPIHPQVIKNSQAPQRNRIAILYGKNGSGKSTIAQGFREYGLNVDSDSVELYPIDGESRLHSTLGDNTDRFFVFDEVYINRNIKVQQSGLGAIVLFGEQVQLEDKINKIKDNMSVVCKKIELQESICNKLQIATDVSSPLYWSDKITHMLQKSGGWAEISGIKIKGNQIKSRVTINEIDRLGTLVPVEDEKTIKDKFDELFNMFSSTSSISKPIEFSIAKTYFDDDIENKTITLFANTPNPPSLTEREEDFLKLFGMDVITSSKGFLSVESNKICPTCLQEISEEHRSNMIKKIDNILNREIEEYRKQLQEILLSKIQLSDYSLYTKINSKLFFELKEDISNLNIAIDDHNVSVQTKIKDPLSIIDYNGSNKILAKYNKVNETLAKLELERVMFNKVIESRKKTESELLMLNDFLAYYDIKEVYTTLLKQREVEKNAKIKLHRLNEQKKLFETEVNELDAKRKNFQIAVDKINQSLEYIFYSKGRLELELGSDQLYHLKSFGCPVMPEKISCGERNALGLCYFFTEITKDISTSNLYTEEMFLVIDDPVSSFDIENKIGILSFLRMKVNQILTACSTTKVLIMTHDISVLFDLGKACEEISKYCAKNKLHAEFNLFHLVDKKIVKFEYTKHNEYTKLLEGVYNYAKSPVSDMDFFIGNMMRRVLEAFSSFLFKKGIGDVSLDEDILSLLQDEYSRKYFQNLMYKLVLNGESHFNEAIQRAPETMFFSNLSSSEKQRTAKDILCFMYKVSKVHILSHLPDSGDDIESWWSDISSVVS